MKKYTIRRAETKPDISAPFEKWDMCETMRIDQPAPGDDPYHPETELRLQYDDEGIYGVFRVRDDAIKCVFTEFQSGVCQDSCVEIFLEPMSGIGYSNFEMNVSGVLLTMHIEDPLRVPGGFKKFRYLTKEEAKDIKIFHTLPDHIPEEINTMTEYRVGFFLPFSLFKALYGAPIPTPGTRWRGNAFKCGDKTSKPHYLSWNKIGKLNFHTPEYFGDIIFG